MDLETLLTHPQGFGLESATPVQRAACRIISGVPLGDLSENPDVLAALGGALPLSGQPSEVILLAAIRSGKSLISACAAVWMTQTCDVAHLGAGEIPRVSVMSVRKDQADVVLNHHIIGRVHASPIMSRWLVGDPTGDGVMLRHPSGRPVEIKVVAGSRAGSSLVARWSAGVVFDEAPRMMGSEDGVVNLDESLHAVRGRMLPGSAILMIGSPWAPFGPVYDQVVESFGKPSRDVVVIRATGPMMNPDLWTPEACEALRRKDPQAYRTDVLGEFSDPEEALFSTDVIREHTRKGDMDRAPQDGYHYVAAMDPATRANAWTLVVLGCEPDPENALRTRYFVALTRQWKVRRGDRLSPGAVLAAIKTIADHYRVDEVHTDQYSADALDDLAQTLGLDVSSHTIGKDEKFEQVQGLHTILNEGRLELSPDPDLSRDLTMVRRKVIQNGVSFVYPKTADGRHCDYVPALALALRFPPDPPEEVEDPVDMLVERRRRLQEQAEQPFWEGVERRFLGVG